jgi:hypothetical protein
MAEKDSGKRRTQPPRADDFKSVAKRLECDPDISAFDAKLKKIVVVKGDRKEVSSE